MKDRPLTISARIQVYKINPSGDRVLVRNEPAHSWVIAFLDMLNVQMSQMARSIPDTGNTARTVQVHAQNFAVGYGDGDVSGGIVVGTGDAAVVLTDYKLGAAIAHGTAAGQLYFHAVVYSAPTTYPGGTRQFRISRTVMNYSGGAITVKEIGLYCNTSGGWEVCLDRSVITPVVIADGEARAFEYVVSISV